MNMKRTKQLDNELSKLAKSITEEDIEKFKAEMSPQAMKKRREEQKKKEEERWKDPRTGVCMVCSGEVIARVTREYLGDVRHMIIGPGGSDQLTTIHHGFHCTNCGLKYEFPPNSKSNKL